MNYSMASLILALLLIPAIAHAQTTVPSGLPAFPGAEGFGAYTSGGRGGDVYEVKNLDDSGPGSFRDAVSAGNRTVVFRVSGTIDLKSPLRVRASNITIAGQTAPGDGICVRGYTFDITGHDVVVRFIRSRLGDEDKQESDGITLGNGVRNVILDHCSATWSVDEALSTAGNINNATIQWCLIGEALNHSIHAKGAHGYGSLARADGAVSWLHNLWAHNNSRNPRLGDNYGRGSHPQFDVRYNVMYDYGEICSGLTQGIFTANYVGNYIRPGPSSKAKTPIHMGPDSTIQFYLRDNIFEGNDALTADNSRFIDAFQLEGKPVASIVNEPFPAPFVAPMTAKQAYDAVLASVGASLPKRDAVDARIVQTVRDRTGTLIDSQNQVGGYPELKSSPAPKDSDHDGMPDEWESKNGLYPNDASDAKADADNDGYTNLEECLNGTNPKQFIDYRDPKNNVDALTAGMLGQMRDER
jgi:pectate lyase